MLSEHDSSVVPHSAQIASPVCGNKYFSSVRLYLAPQIALNDCRHPQNMRLGPWICRRAREQKRWTEHLGK